MYNLDEKGYMMGLAQDACVIVPRPCTQTKLTQDGSQELVTVIETIGVRGIALSPLIIYKGKFVKLDWFEGDKSKDDGEL